MSVTLRIVAKRYILQQRCLNKWIGSAPTNKVLQLSTPYTDRRPYLLKLPTSVTIVVGAIWRINYNHTVNNRTAEIYMFANSHRQHAALHGYYLYSPETVANNEKKKTNTQKVKHTIYKISRSDITHSGDYGQSCLFVVQAVHLVF